MLQSCAASISNSRFLCRIFFFIFISLFSTFTIILQLSVIFSLRIELNYRQFFKALLLFFEYLTGRAQVLTLRSKSSSPVSMLRLGNFWGHQRKQCCLWQKQQTRKIEIIFFLQMSYCSISLNRSFNSKFLFISSISFSRSIMQISDGDVVTAEWAQRSLMKISRCPISSLFDWVRQISVLSSPCSSSYLTSPLTRQTKQVGRSPCQKTVSLEVNFFSVRWKKILMTSTVLKIESILSQNTSQALLRSSILSPSGSLSFIEVSMARSLFFSSLCRKQRQSWMSFFNSSLMLIFSMQVSKSTSSFWNWSSCSLAHKMIFTIWFTTYPYTMNPKQKQTIEQLVSIGFRGAMSPYEIVVIVFTPQYRVQRYFRSQSSSQIGEYAVEEISQQKSGAQYPESKKYSSMAQKISPTMCDSKKMMMTSLKMTYPAFDFLCKLSLRRKQSSISNILTTLKRRIILAQFKGKYPVAGHRIRIKIVRTSMKKSLLKQLEMILSLSITIIPLYRYPQLKQNKMSRQSIRIAIESTARYAELLSSSFQIGIPKVSTSPISTQQQMQTMTRRKNQSKESRCVGMNTLNLDSSIFHLSKRPFVLLRLPSQLLSWECLMAGIIYFMELSDMSRITRISFVSCIQGRQAAKCDELLISCFTLFRPFLIILSQ